MEKTLLETLGPNFRKIDSESTMELYLSTRVLKKEWEQTFPWYILRMRELLEESLSKTYDVKVTLGKAQEASYMLVQYPSTSSSVKELYISYLVEINPESEDAEKMDRLISNVGRKNKHGVKEQVARLVIEGKQLEKIGLDIGDHAILYIVPSTNDKIGYLKIVPKKRLT